MNGMRVLTSLGSKAGKRADRRCTLRHISGAGMDGHRLVHLGDVLYLVGMLGIALLFAGPAWLEPDGLWYRPGSAYSDLTVAHWPRMWFVAQALRQGGQIPLWSPLTMGGAPHVGNPLSALFYPPNWLFAILPVSLGFNVLYCLHLFIGGAAMYGLVRWSYARSPFAAFVGGLGYMLTPKLVAYIGSGHVGLTQAFAWLPLALWLLRGALQRRSGILAAWCGAVLALVYLADPRVALYGSLLVGSYALWGMIGTWRKEGWRVAIRLGLRLSLVPLALVGVGAVQMLPTLELMQATTRSSLTLEDAGYASLPWRYLMGVLIADRGGYHEWMNYLGLAPLGLALLALWRSSERERWFWGGLSAFCILYSLGVNAPLFPLIYRLLPGVGWIRVPTRALLLVALAVNLLAALGVDAVYRGGWADGARRWATLIAFAGLLACASLGIGFALLLGKEMPASILAFVVIGAAWMGWWLLSVRRTLPLPVLQVILAALLLGDLWAVGRSSLQLLSDEEVFADGAGPASYLAEQPGPFRVYSPSYSIPYHVGSRYGLEQLDGADPLALRWIAHFMSLAGGTPFLPQYSITIPMFPEGSDIRTAWREAVPDASLLGLLNGRFVVAAFPIDAPGLALRVQAGGSYLYENERSLPRAFLVARTERVASWEEAHARLAAGYDPAMGALVEDGPALDGPSGWQAARIDSWSPNRIVVEAEADRPSLLILSEVWYPGWRVRVDGQKQPLYRVDGVVRGVYLEPGTHVVTWRYRPASLVWGGAVTLVALAVLLVVALFRAEVVWRR